MKAAETFTSVLRVRDLEHLKECRDEVLAQLLGASVDVDDALDVQLAVSELATNALTHGSSPEVELGLDVTSAEIILTVDHLDAGVGPDPVAPRFPAPTVRSGRGLAIVHSLATSVTATMLGDRSSIIAHFDRH